MDGASKWINWPGLNDKELVVGGNGPRWAFQSRHPYLEDRFIWVRNRGVVWLTRKDIVKDISIRELTSQQFPIAASVFISQYLEQCAQIPLGSKRRATMDPSDESAAKRARFDKSEPVVLTPVTHSPNESASAALGDMAAAIRPSESWPASLSIPASIQGRNETKTTTIGAPESINSPAKTIDAQALPPRKKRSQKSPSSSHVGLQVLEPSGDCESPPVTDAAEQTPSKVNYQTLLRRHSSHLQAECDKLRTENAEVLKAKAALEANAKLIKLSLDASQNTRDLVAKQFENANKQVETLQGRLELMQAQHRVAEQKLREVQARTVSIEKESASARVEVDGLKATGAQFVNELDDALSRIDKLGKDNYSLQANNDALQKANDALQTKVEGGQESQGSGIVAKLDRGTVPPEMTVNNAPGILNALASWAEGESRKSAAASNELDNIKKELAEVRAARDEAINLAKQREGELSSVKSAEPLMLQALAMFRSGTTFK
ncbi:hypothetical protein FIBSPDRAFT_860114 [Athelia psychrophila]|uniref:Uncharacterized protein n=1 Tax=Athelia psychrophila TaxID=1759441 RepID=A0A166KIX7_9AGAM|nr:hypothetical protein FIBSPDRAFT_860114 [Fibularhizoctonia sp. CBS 109695]